MNNNNIDNTIEILKAAGVKMSEDGTLYRWSDAHQQNEEVSAEMVDIIVNGL